MAKAPNSRSLYSVHPGVAIVQKWICELPEKTGRSLDEWLALVQAEGPPTEKERRTWLKEKHGLGTNGAWWIAERSVAKTMGHAEDDPETYLQAGEEYVEAMFAGPKAGLRPVYDALLQLGLSLGSDVKACPCKTIVPLYRRHVFAEIKPATRTRIDLGLALKDQQATGPLIDTGGYPKKDRITHRIPVASLNDINAELKRWLKKAYALDA
jgi:hypothetical protein